MALVLSEISRTAASDSSEAAPTAFATAPRRWQAVSTRERAADGHFVYAVKTTGVFCRPSCASRQPRRENVEFFASTEQAEAAGYRSCKRCQPTGIRRELDIVQRTSALLAAHPEERLSLAQLSAAVHVSPFHLQRLFKRVVGVSPRQYQASLRVEAFRSGLQQASSVTAATFDAGYGSASRMYEAAPGRLGMAPSAYRKKGAGARLGYGLATTPLGMMLVAATERGVCKIDFGDDAQALRTALHAEFANARIECDDALVAPFIARIQAYLRGRHHPLDLLDLPLDIAATAFQERVWSALRQVP
jgi:AraC family transcriptional regulator of adaptative response/methylated-DNA-[protein]-cysteine methyltransferase